MSQIAINNHNVSVVECKGQRVITFKMMDELHERPEGTARRNFNAHKARLVEGEDYFKICADEIRTHKIVDISAKSHEDVTLLTQSGYSMLVKSFTDDLAWQVQKELVRSYFKATIATPKPKRPRKPPMLATFKTGYGIAKELGLDDNQAASHAGRYCLHKCGENPLPALGLDTRTAPTQDNYQTVTELGRPLGLSGQRVNKILEEKGLQVHTKGSSSSSNWSMTDKGLAYGRMFDGVRAGSTGSQQMLKWKPSTVESLRPFAKVPA